MDFLMNSNLFRHERQIMKIFSERKCDFTNKRVLFIDRLVNEEYYRNGEYIDLYIANRNRNLSLAISMQEYLGTREIVILNPINHKIDNTDTEKITLLQMNFRYMCVSKNNKYDVIIYLKNNYFISSEEKKFITIVKSLLKNDGILYIKERPINGSESGDILQFYETNFSDAEIVFRENEINFHGENLINYFIIRANES